MTRVGAHLSLVLKPASWPKLLVPMALGQTLGALHMGHVSGGALAFGFAFTLADVIFIVLLNDWADQGVDTLKRHLFPDAGSPKTLPDGILGARPVLLGALVAAVTALLASVIGGVLLGRPWLGVMGTACLGLFVAYSLPPLALNYRGGGEILETLGVGVALPWVNAYSQSGQLVMRELVWLAGFTAFGLASAVASGLSDEDSDRQGGKVTFVTWLGNRPARRVTERAVLVGFVGWALAPLMLGDARMAWAAGPALILVGVHTVRLFRTSERALTRAFAEQRVYKGHLHRAIWDSAIVLGFGLVVVRLGWE